MLAINRGVGAPVMMVQPSLILNLEFHAGAFGRHRAVYGVAGLVVRVAAVLDIVMPSRVLLRHGVTNVHAKTASHRRPRETCGGGSVTYP